MITEPEINSRGEKRITDAKPYFGCAYDSKTKVVVTMTVPEYEKDDKGDWVLGYDGSMPAGSFTDANASTEGFKADTFLEQWAEVERLGLVISDSLRGYIEGVVLPNLKGEQ